LAGAYFADCTPRRTSFMVTIDSNFECGAGYFHGYMTYKGMKIVHDDTLHNHILVTSSQTA
jgi:hypothetical protein